MRSHPISAAPSRTVSSGVSKPCKAARRASVSHAPSLTERGHALSVVRLWCRIMARRRIGSALFRRSGRRVEQLLPVCLIRADCLLPIGRNQPICERLCSSELRARVLLGI
jgi:hypothetical protein